MSAAIEIASVTRRFGATAAVDGLTLEVARGEIFGLVGPDGAGKTTLMRLICGALAVDSGSLRVDGVDAVADAARVQAMIGYMPQRFSLYPDLSVMENLRFYSDIFGVTRDVFETRSKSLLDEFALTPFRARLADELSGGMKQKLALACTLIHSPTTILLDEPTAGVDPVSRREFWRILYGINHTGTTIFVSTPYMDEAERATRVAFMSRGSILSCGTPKELKDQLQGDIVEILCAKRADAWRLLRTEPLVQSIEVFGDTLHALVATAAEAMPRIARRLQSAQLGDVRIREIPPSLEDAFVAKLAV